MNRRSFLTEALKAATVFTILPGAGRLWRPERLPLQRGILQVGFGSGVGIGFTYRLKPGEPIITRRVTGNILEQYEKTHQLVWDDPVLAARAKFLLKEWTRESA